MIYSHYCWAPFWPKIQIGKKWKIWKVYWKCHYSGHFLSYRKNKDSFGILITPAFRLSTFIFKIHSPSALKCTKRQKFDIFSTENLWQNFFHHACRKANMRFFDPKRVLNEGWDQKTNLQVGFGQIQGIICSLGQIKWRAGGHFGPPSA